MKKDSRRVKINNDMQNIIEFKTTRIRDEWYSNNLDWRLNNYILMTALYSWTELNKRIFITCIYRTEAEDEKIGGSRIHCHWRGVDIRSSIYTSLEINDIYEMSNKYYHYDTENLHLVCKWGDPRHKNHFHFQTGWR